MDRATRQRIGVAIACHGDQAVDKICLRFRYGQRIPAQLIGRCRQPAEAAFDMLIVDLSERFVHRRRPDAIEPRAPIRAARRGKRGARELLGVESHRRLLRRVLPDRKRTGERFGGELVAEAGLIRQDAVFLWRRVSTRQPPFACPGLHVPPPDSRKASTSSRAARMASRSTSRSPIWLASRRISLALTTALWSSDKSGCRSISAW